MKTMKKLSIYILFFSLVCSSLQSQNLRSIFESMPDRMLLPMDSMQRLDIIDFYQAKKTAQVVNGLNDTCRLRYYSENYMELKIGNASFVLALLPMINDSKVLCIIKTVCAPVCDSRLEFYTTEWKPLDSRIFLHPVGREWFLKENMDREDEYFKSFEAGLDMDLMEYHLDKDNLTLTQRYNTPLYLSLDYKEKAKKYIKPEPKTYHWTQVKFE